MINELSESAVHSAHDAHYLNRPQEINTRQVKYIQYTGFTYLE